MLVSRRVGAPNEAHAALEAIALLPSTSTVPGRRWGARGGQRVDGSFDYIVVGAGSAGCVLANRLTASGKHRVLLIEAGGEDRNLWIHVPIGYAKLFADARHNWL